MRKTCFRQNYELLQKLGIIDENGIMRDSYMRFAAEGMMDLHVDNLLYNKISLAHNGIQNGDIMADPDIEVEILREINGARALSFQNDYLGIYHAIEDDTPKQQKKEINIFLHDWLTNLMNQEYKLVETKKESE